MGKNLAEFFSLTSLSEINEQLDAVEEVIRQDEVTLLESIEKGALTLDPSKFDDITYLIRKAFPLRSERITRKSEIVNFFMGQWFVAKQVISKIILNLIKKRVSNLFSSSIRPRDEDNYTWEEVKGICSLQQTLEELRLLFGDLWESSSNYVVYFTKTCSELDPTFKFEANGRTWAHIYEYEYTEAAQHLMLERRIRGWPAIPIIRTALELTVLRTLLDTKYSKKYKDRRILVKNIKFTDLINACKFIGVELQFGRDSLRRLYDWANETVHWGTRFPLEQIWLSLRITENLRRGVIDLRGKTAEKVADSLLERLRDLDKIEISNKSVYDEI